MRSLLFTLIPLVAIACSKDKPTPTSPASKVIATSDAPAAPSNLRIEALTDTSAKVAWDAVEGAADYDLNYKTLSGRWTNWPIRGAQRAYTTIYQLEPETEYRWAVRAENSDGASAWVFAENFTTLDPDLGDDLLSDSMDFDIELIFMDPMPDFMKQAMREGTQMWERVIVGDLPDTSIAFEGKRYDVDDVTIQVYSGCEPGRFRGGNSSFALQRVVREKGPTYRTTVLGQIILRDHYLCKGEIGASYQPTVIGIKSRLRQLAAHEIGHVLGLTFGINELIVQTDNGQTFIGEHASDLFGGPVPIDTYLIEIREGLFEKDCSCHWDGDGFADGVMSTRNWDYWDNVLFPLLYHTSEPYFDFIADVEVAALADMGYQVDYTHVRKSEYEKYRSNDVYLPIRSAKPVANAFHCAGLLDAP